jgi:hypothetical protein
VVADEFLYNLDLLLLFLVSIGALVLFTELGFHLGRRAGRITSEKARIQIGAIQGAILGLLALLLGFTFAMAMTRYEARRQLVVDEANAIGTTFLLAQLLPEPQRQEIADLVRRYVQVRLDFYAADNDEKKLEAANIATTKLQTQLWSIAAALGAKEPQAVTVGLLLQSLNTVIDLHNQRLNALENHVPEIILLLLYFVALVATGLIGYGCGLGGVRNFFVTVVSSILIAAVILVIFDLDRPRHGLIQVSQQRMLELRDSLGGQALQFGR